MQISISEISMSETGKGSSLVRINSDLMDSSFDTVPEAKQFQLRINASDGTKEYGVMCREKIWKTSSEPLDPMTPSGDLK